MMSGNMLACCRISFPQERYFWQSGMASKAAKSTDSDAGGDLRLPGPHGDLQVNACRNPACPNFAVEALSRVGLGRPKKDGSSRTDNYRLNGSQPDVSLLRKADQLINHCHRPILIWAMAGCVAPTGVKRGILGIQKAASLSISAKAEGTIRLIRMGGRLPQDRPRHTGTQ